MRLRRAAAEARALAVAGPKASTVAEDEPLADVREAVELLPHGQREVVLLHYVDGLTCDEVAAALGSTPGAVRVRLHRARAELRRALAPHMPPPASRKEMPMIEMALEDVIVRVDRADASNVVWDFRIVVLREPGGGTPTADLDRFRRRECARSPPARGAAAAPVDR